MLRNLGILAAAALVMTLHITQLILDASKAQAQPFHHHVQQ
jgi:hypothetical protein